MLSESCPRHIPAAGDARGAAEPGLRAVMSISALSQSASSFTRPLLPPVTPARPLGLPDCSCGQNVTLTCCWRAGLGPNPALLCRAKISQCTQVTVNTCTSVKGMVVPRCFLKILACSGRMRDLLPSLCHMLRETQQIPSEGRCPAPSEARSCHVPGGLLSPPLPWAHSRFPGLATWKETCPFRLQGSHTFNSSAPSLIDFLDREIMGHFGSHPFLQFLRFSWNSLEIKTGKFK